MLEWARSAFWYVFAYENLLEWIFIFRHSLEMKHCLYKRWSYLVKTCICQWWWPWNVCTIVVEIYQFWRDFNAYSMYNLYNILVKNDTIIYTSQCAQSNLLKSWGDQARNIHSMKIHNLEDHNLQKWKSYTWGFISWRMFEI